MALKHAKTSAAGPASLPALVGGDDWNADHAVDAGGIAMTATTTAPAAPAAGGMQMWSRQNVGMPLPSWTAPNGQIGIAQNSIAHKRVGFTIPPGASTGFTSVGVVMGIAGTGASYLARGVSSATAFGSLRRIGLASSATAGNYAALVPQPGISPFWRGNAAGLGGFRVVLRWGCADAATVAGARSFNGLTASIFGNVDPSAQLNLIGVGTDSGDANLSLIYNDGAGTATKVALGASFPDHTLAADLYELALYCAPNGSSVNVELTRVFTGDVYRTTVTTDLPSATTFLLPFMWRNNATTALAVAFDMVSMYYETEL